MSLSNPTIIGLLNEYCVPVFVSNEDYAEHGAAAAAEKAELKRIHREGYAKHLSVGTVHAYLLSPDGHVMDSMHTAQAANADLLIAMLRRNIDALHIESGAPVVAPVPPQRPTCAAGELLLHLTARYLERKDGCLEPVQSDTGDWSALPSEDWIILSRDDIRALLPPHATPGTPWQIDPKLSATVLSHFYPPTENWDPSTNRIRELLLSGMVMSVTKGVALARIEGRLKMDHSFYHKPDGRYVDAALVGYMEFEPASHRIRSLRMVTDTADYLGGGADMPYGVAVEKVN